MNAVTVHAMVGLRFALVRLRTGIEKHIKKTISESIDSLPNDVVMSRSVAYASLDDPLVFIIVCGGDDEKLLKLLSCKIT